jgi:Zn-finger nucleic acid-binding protein
MTDTTKIINCPACGIEMQKVYLFDKGLNIDICTAGCGGIYFDNQELQQFSQNTDTDEIDRHYKGLTFTMANQSQKRICPCKTPMAKHVVPAGVQVDTCYNCGGVFLDYGEIDMILNHVSRSKPKPNPKPAPAENMDMDTLRKLYREAQNEERLQEYVYSKTFGFDGRPSTFSILGILSRLL